MYRYRLLHCVYVNVVYMYTSTYVWRGEDKTRIQHFRNKGMLCCVLLCCVMLTTVMYHEMRLDDIK